MTNKEDKLKIYTLEDINKRNFLLSKKFLDKLAGTKISFFYRKPYYIILLENTVKKEQIKEITLDKIKHSLSKKLLSYKKHIGSTLKKEKKYIKNKLFSDKEPGVKKYKVIINENNSERTYTNGLKQLLDKNQNILFFDGFLYTRYVEYKNHFKVFNIDDSFYCYSKDKITFLFKGFCLISFEKHEHFYIVKTQNDIKYCFDLTMKRKLPSGSSFEEISFFDDCVELSLNGFYFSFSKDMTTPLIGGNKYLSKQKESYGYHLKNKEKSFFYNLNQNISIFPFKYKLFVKKIILTEIGYKVIFNKGFFMYFKRNKNTPLFGGSLIKSIKRIDKGLEFIDNNGLTNIYTKDGIIPIKLERYT